MGVMRILVIKHVDREGLGLWEEFCREAGVALDVVALHRGDPLPPPERYEGVISLGGPMNVYREGAYPFLKVEDYFIRRTLSEDVPFLGICLGGQLLAKAMGGLVMQNAGKEIGWHPITLTPMAQRDPLFAGLSESFTVFQWHADTFHPPVGGVRLASSRACRNQAFRFGGNAYALQFHPEVTPPMIEEWAREYRADLGDLANAERILEEAPAQCEKLQALSRQMFENFLGLMRHAAARRASLAADRHRQGDHERSEEDRKVDRARQRYRELVLRGQLRCGVNCPLYHRDHCTGGCW